MKSAAFSYRNSGWNSFEIFQILLCFIFIEWYFEFFLVKKQITTSMIPVGIQVTKYIQKYLVQEWNEGNIYMFYLGLFWIINIATLFEQPWSSDSDRSNEIFLSFLLTKWNHCINHIMKGMACKKHCQVFTKHIQKKN